MSWVTHRTGQSQSHIPLTAWEHNPNGAYGPQIDPPDSSTTLFEEQNSQYGGASPYTRPKKRPKALRRTWEHRRKDPVMGGHLPRISYVLIGAVLLGIWVGLIYYFANHEVTAQDKNTQVLQDEYNTQSKGGKNDSEFWHLQGSLNQFDPDHRVLNVRWSLLWSNHGSLPQPFGTSEERTFPIGIYRDQSLITESDLTMANIEFTASQLGDGTVNTTGLSIDNSTVAPVAVVGMHAWDDFDTDITLAQESSGHAWRTPSLGFPFDRWSGGIVFVANYDGMAHKYNASNSFGTWIDDAFLVDSIINWRIKLGFNNTCTNATGYWVDADYSPCQLEISFSAHRPVLVIFCTVVAVLVNWLSTIFIFIMTGEGVIMRRVQVIHGPELLAVCFTALFALPSVRSILPGAPGFGCLIDLVGIIPNVIIISLCTTMVAIACLRKIVEPEHQYQRFTSIPGSQSPGAPFNAGREWP